MRAARVIDVDFLNRDTLKVTEALMGQYLCRRMEDGEVKRFVITELEAYDGPEDKACHAHRGKTPRNAVIFGPAGNYYVYLCYGIHWLLNIVVGPEDYPAAALVRGIDEIHGPGRVTKALGIDKTQDGQPVAKKTGLWLEFSENKVPSHKIERGPRIGIDYAGPIWAKVPYRFLLQ